MSSTADNSSNTGAFWTPPPKWENPRRDVPPMPLSESSARRPLYHVQHKVPPGDSPYGIAKRVQLVDKNPSKAVSLFWAAINSGDRVDSALKDMAVVMKQLNRSDEAIEAIKSFRHLCPTESQESLNNLLLELYKRSGKLQEEIQMLQVKLKHIEEGIGFGGKRTKIGRSQGKKVHIPIEKEYSRLLGNLAWAYLQQKDYRSAEEHYRKALSLEPDKNKQCNLAICLMHLNKMTEAKFLLQTVRNSCENGPIDESFSRSFERATHILGEFETDQRLNPVNQKEGRYGEIKKSFSSCSRQNRGTSQTANANKHLGSEIMERLAEVHQDKTVPLAEFSGASSPSQDFHDSDISLSGCKGINIKGTLCGCRRQEEKDFMCMKQSGSSFNLAETPGVLFTQPKKCLQLGNKGYHRRWDAEESQSGCSRKLLFKQEKNCENVELLPNHEIDQYKDPESARGSISENRGRDMLGDPAKMDGESSIISVLTGVWKRDFKGIDEKREGAKDEFILGSNTSPGGYTPRMEEFPAFEEDCGQNSTSNLYRMGSIGTTDNDNLTRRSREQLKANVEYLLDSAGSRKRKSWADMVEEDDEELLNESKDLLACEQGFLSQESPLPPKNKPSKHSDDGEAGKQFTDENRNPNMILETPFCSKNQCDSLSQKIGSLVLKDSYYTQPLETRSPANQMARRQFCYSQHGNLKISPLQKRSLNFEDNSAPLEEGGSYSKEFSVHL